VKESTNIPLALLLLSQSEKEEERNKVDSISDLRMRLMEIIGIRVG